MQMYMYIYVYVCGYWPAKGNRYVWSTDKASLPTVHYLHSSEEASEVIRDVRRNALAANNLSILSLMWDLP